MNTNSIQHAPNATRKAETKVCRLRAAYQDLSVKMAAYEQKLKEALRRERARFAKDQERLLREIADAESAQEAARTGLRAAFAEERSAATMSRWRIRMSTASSKSGQGRTAQASFAELSPQHPKASPHLSAPMRPRERPSPGRSPPATADPYSGMASPFHAPPGLVASPHPGQNPVAPGLATGPAPGLAVPAPAAPPGPVETHTAPKAIQLDMAQARP